MTSIILTVRPEPDCELDVEALARRGVPAIAAPLMTPVYENDVFLDDLGLADGASHGGVIVTSRHAVTGLLRASGGVVDDGCRK